MPQKGLTHLKKCAIFPRLVQKSEKEFCSRKFHLSFPIGLHIERQGGN
jgi:hypothetical protein